MKITKVEYRAGTYGESCSITFDNGYIQIDESGIVTISVVAGKDKNFESAVVNNRTNKSTMESGRFYARIIIPYEKDKA